jgi:tetratricopeptide (TPR) repeat protein
VVSLLLVVPTAGISMVGLVAAAGIMAWGYRMSRESRWQALALVKRARKGGPDDQAIALLDQALHVDPSCATALFDSAQRLMRVGRFAAAADYYQQYLYLSPAHTYARTRLADAFLRSSQADAAIPVLVELSADDSLSASTQGSITAELAHVYLVKGDLVQAAELANSKIASKRSLDEGQRQCLRVRAMAQYLGGHRAAGIRDMDRLYAMDPTDVEVQRLRDAMTAETFTLGGNTPPLAEAS